MSRRREQRRIAAVQKCVTSCMLEQVAYSSLLYFLDIMMLTLITPVLAGACCKRDTYRLILQAQSEHYPKVLYDCSSHQN